MKFSLRFQLTLFTFLLLLQTLNSCSGSNDPAPIDPTDDTNVDSTDESSNDSTDDSTDDGTTDVTSVDLATIDRGPNAYSNSNAVEPTEVRAVITDDTGQIIADEIIVANSSVTLSADYDTTRDYVLHVVYKNRYGVSNIYDNTRAYEIWSFPNVENGTYSLDLKLDGIVPPVTNAAQINVNGLTSPLEEIYTAYLDTRTSAAPSTPEANYGLANIPDTQRANVLLYAKFEGIESRTAFVFDVEAGSEQDINYFDLPFAQVHVLENSFPTFYTLRGIRESENLSYPFRELMYTDDFTTRTEVPETDVFDYLAYLGNEVTVDGRIGFNYTFDDFDDLPTSLAVPTLTADAVNADPLNCSFTVSGDYDYYRVSFGFSDLDTSVIPFLKATQTVSWNVAGTANDATEFAMPNLVELILAEDPEITFTLDDMSGGLPFVYDSVDLDPNLDIISYYLDERIQSQVFFRQHNWYQDTAE